MLIGLALATLCELPLACGGSKGPSMDEFAVPVPAGAANLQPQFITAGPDGNVWFTVSWIDSATSQLRGGVARIDPAGVVTELFSDGVQDAVAIASGGDGNLWFTDLGHIGRITPQGTITEFPIPSGDHAFVITSAPDSSMWFTEVGDRLGRVTPDGAIQEFALPAGTGPMGIAVGADGAIWFVENAANRIGRFAGGTLTHFDIPTPNADARFIAAGGDQRLWFTESRAGKIGRIDSTGHIAEFTIPPAGPTLAFPIGIASDDGGLWFVDLHERIGHVDFTGTMTFDALRPGSSPNWIAVDAGRRVWFTEVGSGKIGRLTP